MIAEVAEVAAPFIAISLTLKIYRKKEKAFNGISSVFSAAQRSRGLPYLYTQQSQLFFLVGHAQEVETAFSFFLYSLLHGPRLLLYA